MIPVDWSLVHTSVLLAVGGAAIRYARRVDRVHTEVFGNGTGGGLKKAVEKLGEATAGLHEAVAVIKAMDDRKRRDSLTHTEKGI